MRTYENTLHLLKSLNLKGIAGSLDEVLTDAEMKKESYLSFLNILFSSEISYRTKKRFDRNITGAHFPVVKDFDSFDFGKVTGIGKSEAVNLWDGRWIDKHENLLFFGPPGIGNYVEKFIM